MNSEDQRASHNDPVLRERRRELRKRQTRHEEMFWNEVKNRKLGGQKFVRQFSVGPYILDFYCPEKQVAVELDGKHHEKQKEYDRERDWFLQMNEIRVIRIRNERITQDLKEVLREIEAGL